MSNAQDFGALNWVKDELDISIRQARQALEDHVESRGGGNALEVCGDHLHQIARVLQMVQVYGPSMLAEEMELVVRAMTDRTVRQQEDAAEALMLALIQLPDYLEKLQGGEADIPLIILPLLNDLRAVRDAPLLSEAALFKPEIESGRVAGRITGEPNPELPALAKRMRRKLHIGLLHWYRQRDTEHAWPVLLNVFESIHQNAGTEQAHRLFWVAAALMRGLMEGVIAPGIAVKQLFSRIDRQIKMIVDDGEQTIQPDHSSALLKNLLYYIARAKSDDPLIREVKDAYNLDQVLPSEDQLAQGRQGLSGSNAELAESIRDAVSIELTRIKDILDLFMRDEKADTEMLGHLESPMRKLADTLGMIGQGALRSRLNRQADKVRSFVEKGGMPEEFELMEMAGDILYVESSLSTLHTIHGVDEAPQEEGGWGLNLPEGEYQNLIKQTVREAKVDIAKAKEVIIGFTEATDDPSVLNSVRESFKRVEGALRMLNLLEAAEVMAKTGGFIQFRLIEKSAPPQRHQLNFLADVVSSIEYYLETLVDGAGDRREILAIANASLSALLSEGAEVIPYTEPAEVIDLRGAAERTEGFELEEEVSDLELAESSLHLDEAATEEVATAEDEVQEPSAEATEPVFLRPPLQPHVEAPVEEEPPTVSMDKPALEEIDPEILEIFVEEAREELQAIQTYFPQWRGNQQDQDALTTFRRSFHTLKGSGRLVGAKTIGELAWSVENMLNRLIDETIEVSPEMLSLLGRVIDALPELIDCQEQGAPCAVDVARLEREAFALADGEPLPAEEPGGGEAATAEAVIEEPVFEEPGATLEEVEGALELELEPEELEVTEPVLEYGERDESESIIELDLSSDFSDELLEIGALEEAAAPALEMQPRAFTDSDLEIEVDTELLAIFAEESESHLQEIETFLRLAERSESPVPVPEGVARACHTLRGSANMAGIVPIAKLADAMELYARALHEQQQPADLQVTELLGGGVGCVHELLSWLPDGLLPEPPVETYLERLKLAVEQLGVGKGEETGVEVEAPESLLEAPLESVAVEEAASQPGVVDETPWDLGEVAEVIELPGISERLTEETGEEFFTPGEDQDLIDIFAEESRELLDQLEGDYQAWCQRPDDNEVCDSIKRSLHTLKGSARLAGVTPVGDLSHALENLFNRFQPGVESTPELNLPELVRETLDMLSSQADQAASGGQVVMGTELIEAIEVALSSQPGSERTGLDFALQQEIEAFEAQTEPVVIAAEPEYYEEPLSFMRDGELFQMEGDLELVEIFVEESRELLTALEESYDNWSANPENLIHLDQMQRTLHTLKGSSRLAGVQPVGDLSHALESLIAAVVAGRLNAGREVLYATREVIDLLSIQAEATESGEGIPQSGQLLEHLETLQRESVAESPEGVASEPQAPAAFSEEAATEEEPYSVQEGVFELAEEAMPAEEVADDSFIVMEENVLLDVGEDPELVQIFIEEAKEFVEKVDANFQQWQEQPEDLHRIEAIQRNLHTLKGSARLAGIMPVGDLSHGLESLMTALAEKEIDPVPLVTDTARQAIDHLAHQVEMISSTGKVPASEELVSNLHALLGGELKEATSELVEPIQGRPEGLEERAPAVETGSEPPQTSAQIIPLKRGLDELLGENKREEKESLKRSKEQVRVSSDLMDRLVNNAGEVSIYRARLEQQNSVLGFNLAELEQTVARLHGQLRNLEIETEAQILYRWDRDHEKDDREKAEFDPLEMDRFSTIQQLSRALAETVNDLGNINEALTDLQRETDTLLLQQSRISTDLQDGLLRTRMVPFAQLVPRLQRLVRQTASQLQKRANLECFGIEGELDRGILNRMVPVLEHLLRNSISHGIEAASERERAGKPTIGRISLYLDREANDVLITLSDDGRGLDIEAIRRRAIEQGVINSEAEVSDDDLIQCVLIPGFSTAKEVTQISGRGVGLDVVSSEVKQLGGSLEIDSQPGRGTSFIIRLPLTLAITDALLVRVGEEVYAIPHGSVEGVVRMRRKELLACYAGEGSGYKYAGKAYKVEYLGRMMGSGQHEIPDTARWLPLLLLQTGEHQVGLQVDELLGTRQVVVKSLGKQVGSVRWITGGTILADGRVALILDLSALVRMDATHVAGVPAIPAAERKRVEERLRVMVVDDSITVRKVTSRLLERNDMEVITAKDGVEAVALLQEQIPDIMLLDIEMPRMDGFELARHINNSVDYYGLPIIMISSRVGEKHRQRAMDLGVKKCLGKPYQEAELLDSINEVMAENRR